MVSSLFRRLHCSNHSNYINRLGDIVNANYPSAFAHCQCSKRQTAVQALINRAPQNRPHHALARHADQQRTTETVKRLHMPEQHQIMGQRLGKPEAGIKNYPFERDTNGGTGRHALLEKGTDLGRDIFVMRIDLHVTWLTSHVHQADWQAGVSSCVQRTIALQRAHIIDQSGTQASAFANNRGSGSIH